MLEKKWEYNKDVFQLFIDFEKAYESIKRESLYDILIKFGVPKKFKGGIQAKGIWKQDPEANIWAQEGWEWGVEKAPQWGTS